MKILRVFAIALAVVISAPLVWAQRGAARAAVVDDEYIVALSTADQFMHAWATRNVDEGRSTLTPAALKQHSANEIATVFEGVSSPHHESFEIGPGRRLSATSFAFDMIKYEYLTNMNFKGPRPRPVRLVVVRVTPERWLVDAFPDL